MRTPTDLPPTLAADRLLYGVVSKTYVSIFILSQVLYYRCIAIAVTAYYHLGWTARSE